MMKPLPSKNICKKISRVSVRSNTSFTELEHNRIDMSHEQEYGLFSVITSDYKNVEARRTVMMDDSPIDTTREHEIL